MFPSRQTVVPRSNVAKHQFVRFGGSDHATIEYFNPDHGFFARLSCPPDNKLDDGTPSFMAPLQHIHLLQDEKFYVESGSGVWYIRDKAITLHARDEIIVPRRVAHRYQNAPGSSEPLVIQWRYDAQRWKMEERFFRNFLAYLDDCTRLQIAPSRYQLAVFQADAWVPNDWIHCPGGDTARWMVNMIYLWYLALVGRVILGYKGTYKEYYDPDPPQYSK